MRRTVNKRLSDLIYRLLYWMVRVTSRIPYGTGQRMGKLLGMTLGGLPVSRARIAFENLKMAFNGTMTEAEIRALNRRVVIHFAQMLFEVPHILAMNRENLDRYVVFENPENFLSALQKGKGVFTLTGHFGNWEIMSAAITLRYAPRGAVVVRPIDFEPADLLVNELRTRFGAEIIPKNRGMRRIIRSVRKNWGIGILLDQNVDWYEGVFVPFFGRPACTNKGLARMALKTGTPVIPIFSFRQDDGRYRITFGEEVPLLRTGDKTRDVEDNTAVFTRIIEKTIRKHPEQWFWFHRRWKTLPASPYPRRT